MQKSTLIGIGAGLAALAALYYTVGKPWLAKWAGQAASIRSVATATRVSTPTTPTTLRTSSGSRTVNRAPDPVAQIKAQAGRGELDPTGVRLEGIMG